MNKSLSVFLDLLRLGAAMLVLVGHMAEVFAVRLPDLVHHSAKEGVAIFFVLSGFVIAFVTDGKERDWRSYARSRWLRMLSVVPLALVVLCLCFAIGARIDPAAYGLVEGGAAVAGTVGDPPSLIGAMRVLSFTNELWFARSMISTGAPFWSLGFEVAYYVAFGILLFGRGWWRMGLFAAWLAVCGPRIALAFPLWLIGVASWRVVRSGVHLPPALGWPMLFMVVSAAVLWRRLAGGLAAPLFEWHAPAVLASSLGYYAVLAGMVGLAIALFAATVPAEGFWPPRLERGVRFWAGASFTLYIAHLPLMVLFAVILPSAMGEPARAMAGTAGTVALVLLLAELGERRKRSYASVSASMGRILSKPLTAS